MPKRRPTGRPPDSKIIAQRKLKVAGRRRKAVVTLWQPSQVDEHEWTCALHVTGMRKVMHVVGGDAFQALIIALTGIRRVLDEQDSQFSWLGLDPEDHGFPRIVPHGYGKRWNEHIDGVIGRELTKFVQAELRRRRQERRKRRQG